MTKKLTMKRINIHIAKDALKALKAISKQRGVPYAELIREGVQSVLLNKGPKS